MSNVPPSSSSTPPVASREEVFAVATKNSTTASLTTTRQKKNSLAARWYESISNSSNKGSNGNRNSSIDHRGGSGGGVRTGYRTVERSLTRSSLNSESSSSSSSSSLSSSSSSSCRIANCYNTHEQQHVAGRSPSAAAAPLNTVTTTKPTLGDFLIHNHRIINAAVTRFDQKDDSRNLIDAKNHSSSYDQGGYNYQYDRGGGDTRDDDNDGHDDHNLEEEYRSGSDPSISSNEDMLRAISQAWYNSSNSKSSEEEEEEASQPEDEILMGSSKNSINMKRNEERERIQQEKDRGQGTSAAIYTTTLAKDNDIQDVGATLMNKVQQERVQYDREKRRSLEQQMGGPSSDKMKEQQSQLGAAGGMESLQKDYKLQQRKDIQSKERQYNTLHGATSQSSLSTRSSRHEDEDDDGSQQPAQAAKGKFKNLSNQNGLTYFEQCQLENEKEKEGDQKLFTRTSTERTSYQIKQWQQQQHRRRKPTRSDMLKNHPVSSKATKNEENDHSVKILGGKKKQGLPSRVQHWAEQNRRSSESIDTRSKSNSESVQTELVSTSGQQSNKLNPTLLAQNHRPNGTAVSNSNYEGPASKGPASIEPISKRIPEEEKLRSRRNSSKSKGHLIDRYSDAGWSTNPTNGARASTESDSFSSKNRSASNISNKNYRIERYSDSGRPSDELKVALQQQQERQDYRQSQRQQGSKNVNSKQPLIEKDRKADKRSSEDKFGQGSGQSILEENDPEHKRPNVESRNVAMRLPSESNDFDIRFKSKVEPMTAYLHESNRKSELRLSVFEPVETTGLRGIPNKSLADDFLDVPQSPASTNISATKFNEGHLYKSSSTRSMPCGGTNRSNPCNLSDRKSNNFLDPSVNGKGWLGILPTLIPQSCAPIRDINSAVIGDDEAECDSVKRTRFGAPVSVTRKNEDEDKESIGKYRDQNLDLNFHQDTDSSEEIVNPVQVRQTSRKHWAQGTRTIAMEETSKEGNEGSESLPRPETNNLVVANAGLLNTRRQQHQYSSEIQQNNPKHQTGRPSFISKTSENVADAPGKEISGKEKASLQQRVTPKIGQLGHLYNEFILDETSMCEETGLNDGAVIAMMKRQSYQLVAKDQGSHSFSEEYMQNTLISRSSMSNGTDDLLKVEQAKESSSSTAQLKESSKSSDEMSTSIQISNTQGSVQDEELEGHYMYVAYSRFGNDPRSVLQLCEHPSVPQPDTRNGEVLVKVQASTVTTLDCTIRRGELPLTIVQNDPYIIPGTALVGRVIDPSTSNKNRKSKGGNFSYSSAIKSGDLVVSLVISGANARYACLQKSELVKVPPNLDPDRTVCLVENYLAAFQALHHSQKGNIRYRDNSLKGKSILILDGCTNLGRALVEMANAGGAQYVYALGETNQYQSRRRQRQEGRKVPYSSSGSRGPFGSISRWGGIALSKNPQDWLTLIGRQIDLLVAVQDPSDKNGAVYTDFITSDHCKALRADGQIVVICSQPGMTDAQKEQIFASDRKQINSPNGLRINACRQSGLERAANRTTWYNVFESWDGTGISQDGGRQGLFGGMRSKAINNVNVTSKKDLEHIIRLSESGRICPEVLERIPLSKVTKAQAILQGQKIGAVGYLICNPWMKQQTKTKTDNHFDGNMYFESKTSDSSSVEEGDYGLTLNDQYHC